MTYGTTKFLPRKGRPVKINDRLLNKLMSTINNKTGLSQRQIARRYNVHQSTISRTLRKRTSVVIRKRRKAPKMNSDNQEKTARKNCGKLYRMILNDCDIILDDEKYFDFSGDNVQCNQRFYITDPSTTPSDIKYKKKKKFAPKLLIWMAMSSKGVSNVYVHKSKQAITTDIYLNECINKKLLPFIEKHYKRNNYIFWPDKASAHYADVVIKRLRTKNINVVTKSNNSPNVPQARPIDTLWSLLEQKTYARNWQAKNLDSLACRIKAKVKELDQKMLQAMVKTIRKQLRSMWHNDLYSVC